MPRSVRDSDEDVEVKIGRRTRAGTGSAIPESPIRRSSRNKQSTKQNDSSPDLSVTETSNTQTSRSFRSRAGTVDSNSLEVQRRLRSSKNTVDMNETKDSEVSVETQPKKMTRRSIAAMNTSETPKANTRVRRLTRAGSETKATPTGRVTRKTRASSMDPESTTDIPDKEKHDSQVTETPSRTKRRASVLPSESTVIEEEEKQIICIDLEKQIICIDLDKPLIEEDESPINVSSKSPELSGKSLRSLKNESNKEYKNIDKTVEEMDCSAEEPVDHSSHNDLTKVNENLINEEPVNKETTSISDKNNDLEKDGDDTNNVEVITITDVICNMSTDSLHSIEATSKKIESKEKNILDVSLEEGEINTSDKENECLNTSNSIAKPNKSENTLNVALEEGEINTSNKENECLSADISIFEQNKNTSNTNKLNLDSSINVLDTSVKEDKTNQCNDNTNIDNSGLMECLVAILNCANSIGTIKVNNEIQNDNSRKENNNVPISDITRGDTETSNNKNNMDDTAVMENSDVLSTVSHKILIAEDTIPKQQPLLNDCSNTEIQGTSTREEEDNVETINKSTNNTKEISCEIEPEVNVSVISNNALNVSVNAKEDPIDTSIKVGKCTESVEISEIQNVNNDINESTTPKDSHTKQEGLPSTNANNQDNMSISTHNSSASHIKQDDMPPTSENQDSMSTSTHNSPTMVLQVSDNSNEESPNNTEQMKIHSSECLIDLQSSQPSNSIHETNDSSTVAESHDGPEEDLLDEERSKIKTSSETPKISKRKSVTEISTLETEKEIQKDDVQNDEESDNVSSVGMLFQDISADEWKQKRQIPNTEGENNSIHSTSTVKLDNDSETECDLVLVDKEAWLAAEHLKTIKDKETFDYDSDDTVVLKSKMDYLNDRISNSNQIKILSKDSTQENDNAGNSKLLSKKTQSTLNEKTNIDECDVNVSLQNTSQEKSLNKSKEDVSNKDINSKNDLVKSSDKQLEEEVELPLSQKESEDHEKSENKLASPTLGRKDKKNRSLNNSSNKQNKSKEGSKKYNRLHISSSDEEDEANNLEDNKGKLKGSEKKRSNKNYSTMVHIGSDSDTCYNSSDSSKSDAKNKSLRIPSFLFKHKSNGDESDEFNEDGSSKESIDSDIDLEYNLGGKTIGKFSDDDIPGDECRASESESSDPDDNGSDLADFVVDDDEVEEEDEEDEEDEDDDEDEEEEKNEELDQEMEDMEVTENKSEKKDKDILPSEEKEKDISNKHLNVSNIKNDQKKNQRQKTSIETHSADSDEEEILVDIQVDDISTKLDSTLSEKKKKRKQKLDENNETIEETSKSHLSESELMFTKKEKVANVSLTCSTPKTDYHKHEQFKHTISSEKKKRRNIEKISVSEDSEKVCLKNVSTDNSDNKTTSTNSVNAKKKYSVEKNISADSAELIKDINFTKPFLAKKAYLNKTMSPSNETPTTKYLKKQKLNDSAPSIKLGETKGTSENISLSDNTKDIVNQDETTLVIGEKTADKSELDPSLSAKRKKSLRASTDLDGQTELRHKQLIFETGEISEVDDKAELQSTSGNEKENSKCILKVDDGKKKRKKNKKNQSFQELDIIDMKAKMVEEDVDNDEKVEVICNIQNKKDKKRKKNKKSVENEDKCNDKRSNEARNYKSCIEVKDIPNKKMKKLILEKNKKNKSFQELNIDMKTKMVEDVDNDEKVEVICNIENKKDKKKKKNKKSVENEDKRNDKARQHSKKSLGWDVSKSSTSPNVEFSDGARESVDFLKSKHEALQAAKQAAESIKANKHMKKRMHTEYLEKIQQKKEIGKPQIESTIIPTTKRGIKRLSVDVVENLPDIPMRPHKKQKLSQKPAEAISHNVIKNGFTESGIKKVHKNWVPSNCGGTTEFDVVNLKKAKRQLKKIPPVATFRQKMLSRNSRYPVTSYIMYLQKQRAVSGDHGFLNQF